MKLANVRYATCNRDVVDTESFAMGRRWLRHNRDGRKRQPFQVYMWFHTF